MCLTLLLIVTSVVGRRRGDTAGLQLAAVTNPAAATTTEYVLQPQTARNFRLPANREVYI